MIAANRIQSNQDRNAFPGSMVQTILLVALIGTWMSACQTSSSADPARPFADLDLQRTTLIYVLNAHDCQSCLDTAVPFLELAASSESVWDRRLVLVSTEKKDPGGYGDRLGMVPHFMAEPTVMAWSGASDFAPMMFLFTADHRMIAARPLSFSGHDVEAVHREFEQLAYEFGSP